MGIMDDQMKRSCNKDIELEEENKILKKEIQKLKKEADYNGYYNAFLLDQISETEFKNLTENLT